MMRKIKLARYLRKKLAKTIISAGVFRIIIDKFSYWKEPYPVDLFKFDKGFEIGFYGAVLPLCLNIPI